MTRYPEIPSQPLADGVHEGKDDPSALLSKLPRLTRDQREAIEVNTRRLRELLEKDYSPNHSAE